MSLLLPLTGIAIPKTPPYRITGNLDFADGVVKFDDFAGQVGSSDLDGDIDVDTKPAAHDPDRRPAFQAGRPQGPRRLHRRRTRRCRQGHQARRARPATAGCCRTTPLSVPQLNVADVHLKYTAGRIEGRKQPLDNMRADLDIVDGNVHLHPLSFGIGRGSISGDIALAERANNAVAPRPTIDFQQVDVDKLLEAAGVGTGAGAISGQAVIDGSGSSIARMLGYGNGELKLYMGAGGDLSALLVDLSGLEFGNALLSALGVPNRDHDPVPGHRFRAARTAMRPRG